MSSGLASLYKILKDESRQNIIRLLNEKGNVSYTELLDATETGSTGLLNYHLKVLGDLITKNEAGQYLLTDKGQIALSVLLNFPAEANLAQKRKSQKIFWTILALGQVIILASITIYYFLGVVDIARLTEVSISFVMGIFLAIFGYRMMVTAPAPGSDKMKERMRKAYPLGGAWLGFAIAFFVVGIALAMFARPLLRYFWSNEYFVFVFVVAPALGAIWGYWVGKRNGFNKPKWMVWMDEKTGFA
jgi:hypothetical protein